jgi:alanine dehydrogenase
MKIGCIKEIKRHEYRVGLTPACAQAYVRHGHSVTIEAGAGDNAGFTDAEYIAVGAKIEGDKKAIFAACDMIVKVKEPLPEEYDLFRPGQLLYTYLHLAADRKLTEAMLARKVTGVAYETIETEDHLLPCLKPMSEIAGRLSVQEGAKFLEKPFGGRGVLLGGVPGVPRGKVAIIGGGVVGANACRMAVGMGADVTVLDISAERLAYLDDIYHGAITTLHSTASNIADVLKASDLVIGAVLVTGAKAPHLIRREHLATMKRGSVIVDVAVDQGGCCETTKATTHDNPVYTVDGVVHYAVANMPGAVALTSTRALTSTTLKYGRMLADHGIRKACQMSKELARGLNVHDGHCTYPGVAEAFGLPLMPVEKVI